MDGTRRPPRGSGVTIRSARPKAWKAVSHWYLVAALEVADVQADAGVIDEALEEFSWVSGAPIIAEVEFRGRTAWTDRPPRGRVYRAARRRGRSGSGPSSPTAFAKAWPG